jgi:hypothetical protein
MQFRTVVLIGMGVIGFVIWSYAAYSDPAEQSDYLTFVKGIVVGVAGLALRDMGTSQLAQLVKRKEETKQEEAKQ